MGAKYVNKIISMYLCSGNTFTLILLILLLRWKLSLRIITKQINLAYYLTMKNNIEKFYKQIKCVERIMTNKTNRI